MVASMVENLAVLKVAMKADLTVDPWELYLVAMMVES